MSLRRRLLVDVSVVVVVVGGYFFFNANFIDALDCSLPVFIEQIVSFCARTESWLMCF